MQESAAPLPDFQDTQLAFSYKTDAELLRTYRLFKKIDSPFLVKIGPPLVTFALKVGLPVKGMIRRTIFDVFCGGESLEDTRSKSALLAKSGVKTILDYSVEGEKSERGYDGTRDEILRAVTYGSTVDSVAFSALKVTGIAPIELLTKAQEGGKLTPEEEGALARGKARLEALCSKAHSLGEPIFIDAEETWIQKTIDAWAREMMVKFNQEKPIVYTTIQFYRHEALSMLQTQIADARTSGFFYGVKLVRGAYLEKENERALEKGYPTPMQPDKAATDRDYDLALDICLENLDRVAFCSGSHNEHSNLHLAKKMGELGVPKDHPHVVFAQLLGMSDHISFNLGHHGYRVAKYVPYGPVASVLPYLFRRAQENTSVAGQSSREIGLLRKEIERRKIRA